MLDLLKIDPYLARCKGANEILTRMADAEKEILSLWKIGLPALGSGNHANILAEILLCKLLYSIFGISLLIRFQDA
jgi:hypothetical protein